VILDPTILLKNDPPWILWLTTEVSESLTTEQLLAERGVTARVLSGRRMRTKVGLFNEFASRLSFPDYFGRNWDALADCLGDLECLQGLAYAVVIHGAHAILDKEPPDQLSLFIQLIERVAAGWAHEVASNEDWDRPAIPFHLLLHDSPDGRENLEARFGGRALADISLEHAERDSS
jgi:hypothetical protein